MAITKDLAKQTRTLKRFFVPHILNTIYITLIICLFMENYLKTPFNPFKTENILLKKFKLYLIKFIRRYYNPDEKYASAIILQAENKFVKFLVDIFFNGVILYIALSGLIFTFPRLLNWIYLGSEYWHIPLSIFYLGLIYWTGEKIIKSRGKR